MKRTTKLEQINETIQRIIDDPASSHWLKNTLTSILRRDPMAAATDTEILANLMQARANSYVSSAEYVSYPVSS
jgi:hypothetical protein